jgi:hypothetical protein
MEIDSINLRDNKLRAHYNCHSVNVVIGKNCCLIGEIYGTRKYAFW